MFKLERIISKRKGFTLAEILIVVMVIGVISSMVLPTLSQGVASAQYKTGYRKAYNVVLNLTTAEKLAGFAPSTSGEVMKYFISLNSNLSVQHYAKSDTSFNKGVLLTADDYAEKIKIDGVDIGERGEGESIEFSTNDDVSPWIITEDNFAYLVAANKNIDSNRICGSKLEINAAGYKENMQNVCGVIAVDVNGLAKGPNNVDTEIVEGIEENKSIGILTGDQYYIYIGYDGVTAGSKKNTVTGRLIAELK